jgi:phosphoribosylaminoimidazole-succinocarboxamide synthase
VSIAYATQKDIIIVMKSFDVIRDGNTTFVPLKIYNNGSNKEIILNDLKIYAEDNVLVTERVELFSLGPLAEDLQREGEIMNQIFELVRKELEKCEYCNLSEIAKSDEIRHLAEQLLPIQEKIRNSTLIEGFYLDATKFDLNSDNVTNFTFFF